MTVLQAKFLADQCDKLFNRAALAWERGNNSGNNEKLKRGYALCDKYRQEAIKLLAPLGIEVDFPGLYPSFKVNGFDHHHTLGAISAAIEEGK